MDRRHLAVLLSLAVGGLGGRAEAQDLVNGADVAGTCAACHGGKGQGGKMGEYPRLAGQRAPYLEYQLRQYRERRRVNLPMFPYTELRELPDKDLVDVSAYYASIELPNTMPTFKASTSALDRLRAFESVLVVPKVDGDVKAGEALYLRLCAHCHGSRAQGRRTFPRLVGQYPDYLERQVELYLKSSRPHVYDDVRDDVLSRVTSKEFTNVLAWLTSIQDQPLLADDTESERRRPRGKAPETVWRPRGGAAK